MTALLGFSRVLIVTAVGAERDAVLAGLGLPAGDPTVVAVGVGPAAAAAATAFQLARTPCDAVICAGIAGGFPGRAAPGDVAVATACVAADLGAESPDGFLSLDELGFGTARCPVDPTLTARLRAALPAAVPGEILTVATVTGTARAAETLLKRHPAAVAEAMEGFGAATAAALAPGGLFGAAAGLAPGRPFGGASAPGPGVPFAELRAISNLVGPRDRAAWRIPQALTALRTAFEALATSPEGRV